MSDDSSALRRLFVALLLAAPAGEELMGQVVQALGGEEEARRRFRLPRSDGLHATLFFNGDVAGDAVATLRDELARRLAACPAPRLRLGPAGAFPRPGRERVLWIGVHESDERGALTELHTRVLGAVRAAGFDTAEDERRPLRAHVTVARPRDARRPRVPATFFALDPGWGWAPTAAALVESVRDRGPNLYRPLALFPLAE